MSTPTDFDFNEFSFSNTSDIRLYDVLSVIEFSLELIKNHGRHEFEPVIMQQLRMIFTEDNDYYEKGSSKSKKLGEGGNKFTLFDIIGDYLISDEANDQMPIREAKIFPKITLKRRDYEDLLKKQRFYYFTEKSILEEEALTFEEFLIQNLVKVEDAEGNISYKNIKQCIKLLANKSQGAHYQVYIKKIQYDIISQLNIIAQTLGETTLKVMMPICKTILLNQDKEIGINANADYMKRETFVGLNVYSASPKLE